MDKIEIFYNKNLLNRDKEREITIGELLDFFNDCIIEICDSYYEITKYESNQIEIISTNQTCIKEKEKEILKLILKNRDIFYFKFYFDKFGFTDEFKIKKKEIINYVFSNFIVKGLKTIIHNKKKIDHCRSRELILSDDWSEFLELYLSQEIIKITQLEIWIRDIITELIKKTNAKNDFKEFEKIFNIFLKNKSLSSFEKSQCLFSDSTNHMFDSFQIYKWYYQFFLQFKSENNNNNNDEKAIRLPKPMFQIQTKDEIDFLINNVYKYIDGNSDDYLYQKLDFKNCEMVNYFIEKGKDIGKDLTHYHKEFLTILFNRSLAQCNIEMIKKVTSNDFEFEIYIPLQYHDSISKAQVIELINYLNSIKFHCFKSTQVYSVFSSIMHLYKKVNLTSNDIKINFDCMPYRSSTLLVLVPSFNFELLNFILENTFTFNSVHIQNALSVCPIHKHTNYRGISKHYIIYEKCIIILIKRFEKCDIKCLSDIINPLYLNLLLSTQLDKIPMTNQEGNNYLKENINNLKNIFTTSGLEINVTLSHVIQWLKLKSTSFIAFFKKFFYFLENNELGQQMISYFSLDTILNLETSELFSKVRKLFFKYQCKNFRINLEFLIHYNFYDLVVEQIIENETKKRRSIPLNENISLIMQSSIPIQVFQRIPFNSFCTNTVSLDKLISSLIDLSIKYNRVDIFKYLLSSFENENLLFDYFPILDNLKIDFLEYFLVEKNNLLVKLMKINLPYNFSKLKENETCVDLLSKYLPTDYRIKERFQ
ncbi:hypothetical protein RB653_004392 [Dictyostelium firmibasis]|uniref:Uncharacterized protein n=1 Tax=Dictyostelium firmibasis TaxID=79012 RepID=A0AAN7U7B0_9MYCE